MFIYFIKSSTKLLIPNVSVDVSVDSDFHGCFSGIIFLRNLLIRGNFRWNLCPLKQPHLH